VKDVEIAEKETRECDIFRDDVSEGIKKLTEQIKNEIEK